MKILIIFLLCCLWSVCGDILPMKLHLILKINDEIKEIDLVFVDDGLSIEQQIQNFCHSNGFDSALSSIISLAKNEYEKYNISYPFYLENLSLEDEISLREMADAIADTSCSNKQAKTTLKAWFDNTFNDEEFDCWFRPMHCLDKSVSDERDPLSLMHPSIPCDDRFWVKEGIWLPRVFYSAPQHKQISPMKCLDDRVLDVGRLECPNKTAALLYECESDINYLCTSMISRLMEKTPSCMMYTIGVGGKWSFDDFVASDLRCEVHSMDPSSSPLLENHMSHDVENVYFHRYGLSHVSQQRSSSMVWVDSGDVNGSVYLTLNDLWHTLGHAKINRSIDILRMDCEGCEFQVLHQVATETPEALNGMSIIILELHLTYYLGISIVEQLQLVASFWNHYIKKLGFRIWFVRSVAGWDRFRRTSSYVTELSKYGFDTRKCCYEIGLYREP